MTCEEARAEAAASLLRSHGPGPSVLAHAELCSPCRDEIAALADVCALLPLVGSDPAAGRGADDRALERLLQEAARRSRRRRARLWLVAAAAVLVAVAGVSVALGWATSSPEAVGVLSVSGTDPETGVTADVRMTASGAGSQLAIQVAGVPSGTVCDLVLVDVDGNRRLVSTWTAAYRGEAALTATTVVEPDQVVAVELVDAGSEEPLVVLEP